MIYVRKKCIIKPGAWTVLFVIFNYDTEVQHLTNIFGKALLWENCHELYNHIIS